MGLDLNDFQLKKLCLKANIIKDYCRLKRFVFRNPKKEDIYIEEFDNQYSEEIRLACASLYRSRKSKTNRVLGKITDLLNNGRACFLTLTFDDETMSRTSAETRRQYVRKYLKSISPVYLANIDFGESPNSTHREHYHAVVQMAYEHEQEYAVVRDDKGHLHNTLDNWIYGWSNWKYVKADEKDAKRVSKYVAKLSHHALKEATEKGNCSLRRLIYSRLPKLSEPDYDEYISKDC